MANINASVPINIPPTPIFYFFSNLHFFKLNYLFNVLFIKRTIIIYYI